nr:hypothetical protein [Tanacetum cinerariifolium]
RSCKYLEKEKANLETIESLKSKGFESSENAISESENQNENDCHVNEQECDKVENSKVIAPGMFKLSVSPSVSPISMSKSSCDSKNVEIKLKIKRRKRKSSKHNDKQVNNDVLHANTDLVYFSDLDTFSSIVQICLWIINSGCSKHMTGNRALLTNFVEKFLGIVRFGNNDFAVIAGYGDVVIATINNLVKNNLVQGLPKMKFEKDHLCSACDQGKIYRKHHKAKTAFASNKPLYLLYMDLRGPMHVQKDEVVNLLEKEKENLETIKFLKSKGFESSENVISESENQSENDCLVVEKECDKEENPKVIAPGMFKLNVSQSVSPISMLKS